MQTGHIRSFHWCGWRESKPPSSPSVRGKRRRSHARFYAGFPVLSVMIVRKELDAASAPSISRYAVGRRSAGRSRRRYLRRNRTWNSELILLGATTITRLKSFSTSSIATLSDGALSKCSSQDTKSTHSAKAASARISESFRSSSKRYPLRRISSTTHSQIPCPTATRLIGLMPHRSKEVRATSASKRFGSFQLSYPKASS